MKNNRKIFETRKLDEEFSIGISFDIHLTREKEDREFWLLISLGRWMITIGWFIGWNE